MPLNLTNTTLTNIEFSFGDTIRAGETENFDHLPISALNKSDLVSLLNSGDIILNDGTVDLTPEEAVAMLNGSYLKLANIKPDNIETKNTVGDTIFEADKETGQVKFHGLLLPSTDGTDKQVLTTDGAGNLHFADPAPSVNRKHETIPSIWGTAKMPESTAPTITDGSEVFTTPFTLNQVTSRVRIHVTLQMGTDETKNSAFGLAIFRDNVLVGGAVTTFNRKTTEILVADVLDIPGDTEQHTYSLRCGTIGGSQNYSWVCSRLIATDWDGALSKSSSVIIEEDYVQ